MTTILRIDASARDTGSVSRGLGDTLERRLLAATPNARVVRRDLVAAPLPHIAQETIAGYYTPADQMTDALRRATALSDELIGELTAADVVIVTVPMYNFSIPSALKAWIDQIVRIGRTFSYDGSGFTGLVGGKKVYVVAAYGAAGYAPGEPFAAADFLTPYLRFLFGFLGMTDVTVFPVEATTAAPEVVAANRARAEQAIAGTLAAV